MASSTHQSSLPAPAPAPAPPASSPPPDLNTLLTRYLHLLDERQRLHDAVRASLRAGHLALAEANFRSTNRAARFGQDLYDDKMRATLVLEFEGREKHHAKGDDGSVESRESKERTVLAGCGERGVDDAGRMDLLGWSVSGSLLPTRSAGVKKDVSRAGQGASTQAGDDTTTQTEGEERSSPEGEETQGDSRPAPAVPPKNPRRQHLPTPPVSRQATPASPTSSTSTAASAPASATAPSPALSDLATLTLNPGTDSKNDANSPSQNNAKDTHANLPPDPIRQFGILVPPALRSAQTHFRQALLGMRDEDTNSGKCGMRNRGAGDGTVSGEGAGIEASGTVGGDGDRGGGSAAGDAASNGEKAITGPKDVAASGERVGGGGLVRLAKIEAELGALEVEVRRARKRLRKQGGERNDVNVSFHR